MKHVRELMQTDVTSLQTSDHLDLVNDIMKLGRIRHLPVLEGDRVVGIVSQRDLLRAGISSVLQFRPSSEREWLAKIVVREIMVKPVVTIGPNESLGKAIDLLVRMKIGCLPVVENDKLVGLLSETDLLVHLSRLIDRSETQPVAC